MMKTMISRWIIFGILFAVLQSAVPALAQIDGMNTEQLLEYTLEDLHASMDQALARNNKLSAKNESIRKRILFMRENLREMGDARLQLREDAVELRSMIKLRARELETREKQLNSIQERKRALARERETFAKRTETLDIEQELLQQKVDNYAMEIKELQMEVKSRSRNSLLDYYSEEKARLREMVKAARARIRDKQSGVDLLDVELSRKMRSHEKALHQNEILRDRLTALQLSIEDLRAQRELLRGSRQRLQQAVKDRRGDVGKDVARLRGVIVEYRKVKEEIQDKRKMVISQAESREADLKYFLGLLEEENRLLFEKKQVVRERARLADKEMSSEHTALIKQDDLRDLNENKDVLANAAREMKDQLAAQQKESELLQTKEQRLQDQIDDLAARLARTAEETAQKRQKIFGDQKEELTKLLAQYRTAYEQARQEQEQLEQAVFDREQELRLARNERQTLKSRASELEQTVRDLEAKSRTLKKKREELSRQAKQFARAGRKEIKTMEMRKRALSGSLDVINKKYQAGQVKVKDFRQEEDELEEYLAVIRNENRGLQKKLMSLKERLGQKKASP